MVVMNVMTLVYCCSASLIPRQVLFGTAAYEAPSISPDGSQIACLIAREGVLNIWVRSVSGECFLPVTQENERSIRRYFWSPDSKKIFYLQDTDGNENWHLFSIDLETNRQTDCTPFAHVHTSIVAVRNNIKDYILIALNKNHQAFHDVYKLNINTNQLTLAAKNPGNIIDWFADRFLHIRLAIKSNADGGRDVIFRRNEYAPWRMLFSWSALESLSCSVLDFAYNGFEFYCLDNRFSDTVALTSINTSTYTRKIIAQHEHYDISGVQLHPELRMVQAYTVVKQRKEIVVLDPSLDADLTRLKNFSEGDLSIISRDYEDKRWIAAYVYDNQPITYVYYDRITKVIRVLFENKPDLRHYHLVPTESVKIQSRDGLILEGYCTKPLSWTEGKKFPLVIVVHGGPWSRDAWGYDMEAQWLANRGYICLRVNYRGSTGYGKSFLAAGIHEWGGAMLNDVVNAVQWAIGKGIADPKRIGIMGFSYGGYTALCGITMTNLFACGISVSGPSNLGTFLTSLPPYFEPMKKLLYTLIGDPDTEPEFLKIRSPLFYMHNLEVPLMIVQGLNDPRVKKSESDQIVSELVKRNLVYDYLLFPDEGHGLVREKNRLMFYARAESFLAQALHGLNEEA